MTKTIDSILHSMSTLLTNIIQLTVAFLEKDIIIRIILITNTDSDLIMDNINIDIARTNRFILHPFTTASNNKIIDTDKLFEDGDVVLIQHQGEQYHLRRTRNGKLILTK